MNEVVFLDTSPLGLACFPKSKKNPKRDQCIAWLESLVLNQKTIVIPEIADYELRRELIRFNSTESIKRLDELKSIYNYLPITTEMMLKAAELWADVRNQGMPTAHDHALDGDVILAAQAIVSDAGRGEVIIATSNPGHLTRLANADEWWTIS
jgi:predicted nucleic acid-binding protein